MSFSCLSSLVQGAPLRIRLIDAGDRASIGLAGVVQPLRLTATLLGPERLRVDLVSLDTVLEPSSALQLDPAQLTLVVGGDEYAPLPIAQVQALIACCNASPVWGATGAAVLWLVQAGALDGLRTALPWALYPAADAAGGRAILAPVLFECDGGRLTCCGGAASIDFALTLVREFFGEAVQARIMEELGVDRVRAAGDRRHASLPARFAPQPPSLSEAVDLMEANIEEPLATDDIAGLVGLSRRQLERQFKQVLGTVPSRYYLELRLQRARRLLLDSSHSIVQVGLMCGFSSASHFSTAYGAMFGMTPREERRRKLLPE